MTYAVKISLANEMERLHGAPPDIVIVDEETGETLLVMTGEPAIQDRATSWWKPGPLAQAICDFLNGRAAAPDVKVLLQQVQDANMKVARDLADTATVLMAALGGNGQVKPDHLNMLEDIRGNMLRIVHGVQSDE